MKRREFITFAGGAAAWPLAAGGQQMPVVGFLGSGTKESDAYRVLPFGQGLAESGYVAGRDVAIEYRWAQGHYDQLPALATDLVIRKVAAIVAGGGTASALAAKTATATVSIPVVFAVGGDPVKFGLVASLNRPGGNITGVSSLRNIVPSKQFELLHESLPEHAVVGLLVNPTNPNAAADTNEIKSAADATQRKLLIVKASSEGELQDAFALVSGERAGLIVTADPFFTARREQLVGLATRHAVPVIYDSRQYVAIGGLMSYGSSVEDSFRLVGVYIGRILRGDRPAELPVQQSVKLDLVINLKTAKALGLDIPPTLLARADEVIE